MSTLNQIGSKVMNYLRGGFQVDDNKIDWELIYDEIHKQRAVAIQEEFRRSRQLDASLFQEICCLEVKCRDIICNGISSGDSERYVELPGLLVVDGKSFIKYFGGVDKMSPYSELTVVQNAYRDGMLYGKKKSSYIRIASEAIVYDPPTCGLKYSCLIAILDNPMNGTCYKLTEEEEYPLSKHLEARVEYLCINTLIGMLNLDPEQLNNARDDLRQAFGYPQRSKSK